MRRIEREREKANLELKSSESEVQVHLHIDRIMAGEIATKTAPSALTVEAGAWSETAPHIHEPAVQSQVGFQLTARHAKITTSVHVETRNHEVRTLLHVCGEFVQTERLTEVERVKSAGKRQ